MDTYQAVYDATRSRLSNCDVGSAIESALRNCNFAHYAEQTHHAIAEQAMRVADEQTRPSVLYRPAVFKDGDQWCALLGENLQVGVCGFGDSPNRACHAFDMAWIALPEKRATAGAESQK